MSYLVLARKWRPQRFDEVIGQRHVSLTLTNALKTGRLSHAYLFSGPRGVGKTSVARILAKAINCAEGPTAEPCNQCDACRTITDGHCLDVLEIDGASNRGIDDVRQLRESVKYTPSSVRTKVYIIDEVHMLTTDAFNALLKTLEEPPSHVCFMMATTEPLKVPPTILSRCQRFDFGRVGAGDLHAHLRRIADSEGLAIEDEALLLLARKAEGGVRDSLTLLDQVAATGTGPFNASAVQELLGLSGGALYFEISEAVVGRDPERALLSLQTAYRSGAHLQEVAEELVQHFRNILLLSLGKGLEEIVEVTTDERALLMEQTKEVRPADALRWLRILLDVTARIKRSAHARVHLEVALAEMASLPRAVDLGALLANLGGEAEGPTPEPPARKAHAPRVRERPPASSAGDLTATWERVVARIRAEKAFLASCLEESQALGMKGGRLQIALADANGFKRDQVEKPANRRYILAVLEELAGRPLGIRLTASDTSPAPQVRERPATSDRAQHIADLMDGDIVGPAH